MRGLEKEYAGRIEFIRLNILNPETEPLQEQYGFSATPEFYLLDPQGEVVGFWDDSVEVDDLRLAFDQALGKQ